jgi:hypothetical protein
VDYEKSQKAKSRQNEMNKEKGEVKKPQQNRGQK